MFRPDSLRNIYTTLTSRGCKIALIAPLLVLHIVFSGNYGVLIGLPLSGLYVGLHLFRFTPAEPVRRVVLRLSGSYWGLPWLFTTIAIGILIGLMLARLTFYPILSVLDALSARYLSLLLGTSVLLYGLTWFFSSIVELRHRGSTSVDMLFAETFLLLQGVVISTAVVGSW